LPDDVERATGRLAAVVLANQTDTAAEILGAIQENDADRQRKGLPSTGLTDNALDLFNALEGSRGYPALAEALLDREDLDPVLRSRIERYLESQPLRVAEERLREDRVRKWGSVFNRTVAPASRLFTGGALPALESGRAAIASLLVMHSFPKATTQERQALRAYQDFLARHPDTPERPWVEKRIERYRKDLYGQLFDEALKVAERALRVGQPDAALLHLGRAERLVPDDPRVHRLRLRAEAMRARRDQEIRRSFQASALIGIPLGYEKKAELERLAIAILQAPADEISRHATAWEKRHGAGPLADEMQFLRAYWHLAYDEEDAFFRAMHQVAELDPESSSMARHARWIVRDPAQNPHAVYRVAERSDRRQRLGWIFLGRRANGPIKRDLPRSLEWILDAPGFVVSIAKTPIRLLQYRAVRSHFGGVVIDAGENYVARFPGGEHSQEVNARLEDLYAIRGHWSQALEHHRAREDSDPDQVAQYREKIAERTLMAARLQRRLDVRASIYRSLLNEYGDTPQAEEARREFQELVANASPQHIRLSKEFLLEHPELWDAGALGLHADLFDGEKGNGEIDEGGVTLVGRTVIRVALLDREPVLSRVPPERFARFIAALEQVSYRELMTDAREKPIADPQRDLFFERARLGLLDSADVRPAARSEAEFLSTKEKHGGVLRRESVLPVEVVLQGGLEDFGFAAFPRIRLPRETPDAFLYR
jgi:hypothetical protein